MDGRTSPSRRGGVLFSLYLCACVRLYIHPNGLLQLLYELVHGGKEIKVDKDGRPRLVSSENAEEEGYLIEDLEDEEGASSASDEEDKDKEGEDGEERNERECEEETRRGSLFDRTLKNRKKTRQDRNRRLRFLQQQRRVRYRRTNKKKMFSSVFLSAVFSVFLRSLFLLLLFTSAFCLNFRCSS